MDTFDAYLWALTKGDKQNPDMTQIPHPQTPPQTQDLPVTATLPPNPDSYTYPWDTPHHNWHNARVLCDQAGLTLAEKNDICACLYQESELFNVFPNGHPVTNHNMRNGQVVSTDWGIAQINDYWHVKRYADFKSSDDIIAHPEKAVGMMIHAIQNGTLTQWVSYSSGAYKQWLKSDSPMWKLSQ